MALRTLDALQDQISGLVSVLPQALIAQVTLLIDAFWLSCMRRAPVSTSNSFLL
jgi:hypothetical protein